MNETNGTQVVRGVWNRRMATSEFICYNKDTKKNIKDLVYSSTLH